MGFHVTLMLDEDRFVKLCIKKFFCRIHNQQKGVLVLYVCNSFLLNTWSENCALLGYYAESSGNSIPLFQEKQLVSPPPFLFFFGKMCPIGCPETSVWNYHYSLA